MLSQFFGSSLRTKLTIFFVLIALIPLFISNIMWFYSSQNQALNIDSEILKDKTLGVSGKIDNFFQIKKRGLLIFSQTDSIINLDQAKATTQLQNLLKQDEDIQELTLVDAAGNELVKINRQKNLFLELTNQASSPAFKTATFLAGNLYFSPIQKNNNNDPEITIALPIIPSSDPSSLGNLIGQAQGQSTNSGQIKGVLEEKVGLNNLFEQIINTKISQNGYLFMVDNNGTIILHSNKIFSDQAKNLKTSPEVARYLNDSNDSGSISSATISKSPNETGIDSLMTHIKIEQPAWGLIAQIPNSDTLNQTRQTIIFEIILFFGIIGLVFLISYWISQQIVTPLQYLQQGAKLLGEGNLNYRMNIKSGGEIEDLSKSINFMANNLQTAFSSLEDGRNIIIGERNKLQNTISNVADSIIAVDQNRNIAIFNRSAQNLTGYKESDVLGKPIDLVLKFFDDKGEILPSLYFPIDTVGPSGVYFKKQNVKMAVANQVLPIDQKTLNPIDPLNYWKNSELSIYRYVNMISALIKGPDLVNLGCIITLHDLREERDLEEMKLDFVSMAAHELRTPLTSLKGYLYILLKDDQTNLNSEQIKFLTRANISSQRLVALVENLLNVSRIERGTLNINFEEVDWMTNIRQTIAELNDQAKDKNQKIVLEEPESILAKVLVDNLRINEVVTNLLANAISYTQNGGTIRIWFDQNDQEVITHIQDNGPGIPKEALNHLFTKFFRVKGKLEQGSKGTGLGLFITKSIIQMHHGRIWVESVFDHGSTFSFSLLRADRFSITPNQQSQKSTALNQFASLPTQNG